MSDILNKTPSVLKLSRLWWALGFVDVKKAFEDVCSLNKRTGKPPQMAVDIMYAQLEDGTYDTTQLLGYRPVSIEEWLELPVRSCDQGIQCSRRLIRVPTVTICTTFERIPDQKPRFSGENLAKRDGGICQATKRKLAPGQGNIGHDIARSKGGPKNWTNTAWLDKDINRMQGTRSFAEMGWDITPREPRTHKVFLTLDDARHEDHRHFLKYQHSAS